MVAAPLQSWKFNAGSAFPSAPFMSEKPIDRPISSSVLYQMDGWTYRFCALQCSVQLILNASTPPFYSDYLSVSIDLFLSTATTSLSATSSAENRLPYLSFYSYQICTHRPPIFYAEFTNRPPATELFSYSSYIYIDPPSIDSNNLYIHF